MENVCYSQRVFVVATKSIKVLVLLALCMYVGCYALFIIQVILGQIVLEC